MNKINLTIFWIKKNKWKVTILLSLFLTTTFIYFLNFKKAKSPQQSENSSVINEEFSKKNYSYDQNDIPKYKKNDEPYLLNKFDTTDKVNGYGWKGNHVLYSTKNGIYDLLDNKPIFESLITRSVFSKDSSKVIYKNSQGYFMLDTNTLEDKKIEVSSNFIKVDDNLNFILFNDDSGLLYILDILNRNTTLIKTNKLSYEFGWIHNRNKFYVYYPDLSTVDIFETSGQRNESIEIKNKTNFITISPNLDQIVTSDNDNLYIIDKTTDNIKKTSFKNANDLKIDWINENDFIVIEKDNLSDVGIYDQYLWILDTNGIKTYFSNSLPIISKLNENRKLVINEEQSAVIAEDNDSSIWIYSLKPGFLPTYNDQGIFLYRVPNVTKEDSD